MSDILPQSKGVYKYKGDTGIFIKLQSLAHTHGDKTIGELEAALNTALPGAYHLPIENSGECPINLPPEHCKDCQFNPTRMKCEYYEIRRGQSK